jgi:hypothetical protein
VGGAWARAGNGRRVGPLPCFAESLGSRLSAKDPSSSRAGQVAHREGSARGACGATAGAWAHFHSSSRALDLGSRVRSVAWPTYSHTHNTTHTTPQTHRPAAPPPRPTLSSRPAAPLPSACGRPPPMTTPSPTASPTTRGRPLPPLLPLLPLLEEKKVGGGSSGGGEGTYHP